MNNICRLLLRKGKKTRIQVKRESRIKGGKQPTGVANETKIEIEKKQGSAPEQRKLPTRRNMRQLKLLSSIPSPSDSSVSNALFFLTSSSFVIALKLYASLVLPFA